jgi:hypothetical protein
MNIKTLTKTTLLSSLISLSCFAFAAEMSSDNEKWFKDLDLDKNNVLTIDEAERNTLVFQKFDKIDKNHDGKLEASEFSAFEVPDHYEPPVLDDPGVGAAPLD